LGFVSSGVSCLQKLFARRKYARLPRPKDLVEARDSPRPKAVFWQAFLLEKWANLYLSALSAPDIAPVAF
jgi:hypothetical protein|tara:strand:- start:708 stop:917 length:210 start_codon:yes stop_codon:yes gene_type:complete